VVHTYGCVVQECCVYIFMCVDVCVYMGMYGCICVVCVACVCGGMGIFCVCVCVCVCVVCGMCCKRRQGVAQHLYFVVLVGQRFTVSGPLA